MLVIRPTLAGHKPGVINNKCGKLLLRHQPKRGLFIFRCSIVKDFSTPTFVEFRRPPLLVLWPTIEAEDKYYLTFATFPRNKQYKNNITPANQTNVGHKTNIGGTWTPSNHLQMREGITPSITEVAACKTNMGESQTRHVTNIVGDIKKYYQ